MKLAYMFLSCPNRLWVQVLRANYRIQDAVPSTLSQCRGLWLWKGIRLVWSDVYCNIVWSIGDGSSMDFWEDAWVGDMGPLCNFRVDGAAQADLFTPVNDFVLPEGDWKWDELQLLLTCHILLGIAAIKAPLLNQAIDLPSWSGESSRNFTAKSAYFLRVGVENLETENIWVVLSRYRGLPHSLDAYDFVTNKNPKNFGSSLRVHLNELLTQNWEVRFTWVRRECNLVADGMTKIAWDIPFGYHQFLDPPDLVKELLQQDVAAAASPNFIFFVSPCPFK
ncbi:hypothetical protein V6N13_126190 [Hibiscus sabdariffa]